MVAISDSTLAISYVGTNCGPPKKKVLKKSFKKLSKLYFIRNIMEYQIYFIINVVKLMVTVSVPTMAFNVSVTDTRKKGLAYKRSWEFDKMVNFCAEISHYCSLKIQYFECKLK